MSLQRSTWVSFVLAMLLVSGIGCGGGTQYYLANQSGVVTLVNLHPDMVHRRLYSTNYQQVGLIPLCTPVTITRVTASAVTFTVDGVYYEYVFAPQLVADHVTHLDQIFGTQCPDTRSLSHADQEGIRAGRATVGMTRRGVVLAIGLPPDHVNQPDSPIWKYWKNRFDTLEVEFRGNVVSKVTD